MAKIFSGTVDIYSKDLLNILPGYTVKCTVSWIVFLTFTFNLNFILLTYRNILKMQ